MISILFVDDEPNILSGLRRMLRSKRDEWDMTFVEGAQQALEKLEQSTYDIIVSDIRMPGISGIELLKEVKQRYPAVTRLALSGHADLELALESTTILHQYMSKPCEPETIKKTIERAVDIRKLVNNEALQAVIGRINKLPSPPALYFEVTEELQSRDASPAKIAGIIEKDVAMTAKIIQLASSAIFGRQRTISTVLAAVQSLGLDIIKSLILAHNVVEEMSSNQISTKWLDIFVRHSLLSSLATKRIYSSLDNDSTMASCAAVAGMLHDIGLLLLRINFSEKYKELYENAVKNATSIWHEEQKTYGVTHAEVGAYLLGMWNFPNPIVEAVLFQHTPSKCITKEIAPLTAVHIVNALLDQEVEDDSGLDLDYLTQLGIADQQANWRELCLQIVAEAENE